MKNNLKRISKIKDVFDVHTDPIKEFVLNRVLDDHKLNDNPEILFVWQNTSWAAHDESLVITRDYVSIRHKDASVTSFYWEEVSSVSYAADSEKFLFYLKEDPDKAFSLPRRYLGCSGVKASFDAVYGVAGELRFIAENKDYLEFEHAVELIMNEFEDLDPEDIDFDYLRTLIDDLSEICADYIHYEDKNCLLARDRMAFAYRFKKNYLRSENEINYIIKNNLDVDNLDKYNDIIAELKYSQEFESIINTKGTIDEQDRRYLIRLESDLGITELQARQIEEHHMDFA